MSESLVVIRTFGDLFHADEAQVELLSAGIYSLLCAEESPDPRSTPWTESGIALAVHQRDAGIAEAVLAARAHPS